MRSSVQCNICPSYQGRSRRGRPRSGWPPPGSPGRRRPEGSTSVRGSCSPLHRAHCSSPTFPSPPISRQLGARWLVGSFATTNCALYSLGHDLILQSSVCVASPLQAPSVSVSEHWRSLSVRPHPQVVEQGPQSVHSDQVAGSVGGSVGDSVGDSVAGSVGGGFVAGGNSLHSAGSSPSPKQKV